MASVEDITQHPINVEHAPRNARRIRYLRTKKNKTWRQIGEELGISPVSASLLYRKWFFWEYIKDPRGRKFRTQPTDPEKIFRIVHLRDNQNMRWRQIGVELGESHQAPYLLYKKWASWAYSEE